MPAGIELICLVYLFNAVLYIISILLFYNRILIYNVPVWGLPAGLIRFILIFIPLYLYFRLKKLKRDSFYIAILFHSFFIINGILDILEKFYLLHPIIRIVGISGMQRYSFWTIFVILLSTGINLLIFGYLLKNRKYFLAKIEQLTK